MTYKQIESSRNTRLWITEVVIPVASLATTVVLASPKVRKAISSKGKSVKNFIKKTFKKKESETKRVVISIKAKNRDEALNALEKLAKEVIESTEYNMPINKVVQINDFRKV